MKRFVSSTLLIVNDTSETLHEMREILGDEFRLIFAQGFDKGLQLARAELPDLILSGVVMAKESGFELCRQLKQSANTRNIPVIFLTQLNDNQHELEAFKAGAVDYLVKPFNHRVLKARIYNHLSLVQADEVINMRVEIIHRLSLAADYKDNETGQHVVRMSQYCAILARALGFDQTSADDLLRAAPMHDVGKIGIPDHILQKPGKLTDEEWHIMREHPVIGARIIGQHTSGLLGIAYQVALTHHERWDGSGYPQGLKGEQIPLCGRIAALADVYDALTTDRPYKKAWSVKKAARYIQEQSGKQFDPEIVRVFIEQLPAILMVSSEGD